MKITHKHLTSDWALVSLQGDPDGEGYLVKPSQGTTHFVSSLDEPRKFGHGQYVPVVDHNEISEDQRNHIYRLVEAAEMNRH